MNDQSENPNERMELSGPAPAEGGGGGSSAPRRPRKRRRGRRSPRPKATAGTETVPGAETNALASETPEAGGTPAEPESDASAEGDEEGRGDESAPVAGGQGENPAEGGASAAADGAGATGAVHKKRRHRGGRRHRRHRPEGAAGQPETAEGAVAPLGEPAAPPLTVPEPAGVRPPAPTPAARQQPTPSPRHQPAPAPRHQPAPSLRHQPAPVAPAPAAEAAVSEKRERPALTPIRSEVQAPVSLKIPGLDAVRAKKALVEFLQEQREIRGRARAIMELSGELNSITTSALLAEALGGDQVELYFFLDGEPENQARREQARLVASRLGRNLEFKDLRPILTAVYADEADVDAARRAERIVFEKQAWLLDLAEAHNAMVVQSTNKTERLLTRSAGQVGEGRTVFPLGDVYQSQVIDLARVCNIPGEAVNPTRDFSLAQELGLKTAEIDGLLYQMLDVKVSLSRLMDLGLPEGKVHALYQKLRSAAQVRRSSAWESMGAYYVPRPWSSAVAKNGG